MIPEYQEELTGIFDVLSGYRDLLLVYHELRDEASGYVRAGARHRCDVGSGPQLRHGDLASIILARRIYAQQRRPSPRP